METKSFYRAIAFTSLFLAAILPTLVVRIPAMEDYLDHLSRMYILAASGTNEANPYYQVSWALYPYLAMDLIVPLLGRVISIEAAAKVFFLTSQLLIVTGAVALEIAVKRRHALAGFAALLTLHSMPFSLGLLEFEFGTGIALWGIAAWIALSRHDRRLCFAANAIFVPVLSLSHMFALGIYGLTIGMLEFKRLVVPSVDVRRVSITAIGLVGPVVLMFFLMNVSGATTSTSDNQWWFTAKPIWLALFLNGYNIPLAAGSGAALAVLLIYGAIKRDLYLSADGKWIALGFLLVFVAMPFKLFGSRMADIRMITAALLILPAFANFTPRARSFGYLAAAVVGAIIVINIGYTSYVWISYQDDYKAMKASFALLRQNSFVLVGSSPAPVPNLFLEAPMSRSPTLAVHYAKSFVSSLYTLPGTHAVEVRPEWQHLDVNGKTKSYQPPSLTTLKAIAEGGNPSGAPRYIHNWADDFDYVYVLGPHPTNDIPARLEEIAANRRFTLYRIRRPNSIE